VIVEWTEEALFDVERLYLFLAAVNIDAATKIAARLESAPDKLLSHPRIGARLEGFNPREVRRIIVGNYEMRYEILDEAIYIVRVWHSREDRSFATL
jgi:plasmid stabilization system protein ParE